MHRVQGEIVAWKAFIRQTDDGISKICAVIKIAGDCLISASFGYPQLYYIAWIVKKLEGMQDVLAVECSGGYLTASAPSTGQTKTSFRVFWRRIFFLIASPRILARKIDSDL
jgi:hypothetical protein